MKRLSRLINFAQGIDLPIDAATQTFGFLGRKRQGKTTAAKKLVEGLHRLKVPVVILDPIGVHWGIRLLANGKGTGLNFIILGGHHGDIPLDANAGALVADVIVDTGRSFVLDVSLMSIGERKRFVFSLMQQLWRRQKGLMRPHPVHIVLEEAQTFLPQKPMPEDRPMVGVINEMVRLGGNKGIGFSLITQRPQSVDKESLTQVECMVVFQVNGPPEKKVLKEWLVDNGVAAGLLDQLPFLKPGVCLLWSPQWLEKFVMANVLMPKTFNASATPTVGDRRAAKRLKKPIDLEKLKGQMADTVKVLEENDVGALKRKLRELERVIAEKHPEVKEVAKEVVVTKRVEVPVMKPSELAKLEKATSQLTDHLIRVKSDVDLQFERAAKVVELAKRTVDQMRDRFRGLKPGDGGPEPGESPRRREPMGSPVTIENVHANMAGIRKVNKMVKAALKTTGEPISMGSTHLAILRELRSGSARTANYLAVHTGVSPSSIKRYVLDLKGLGHVETTGHGYKSTEYGRAMAPNEPPPIPAVTLKMWLARFDGAAAQILEFLYLEEGKAHTAGELAERFQVSESSVKRYVLDLRNACLIETTGHGYAATQELLS